MEQTSEYVCNFRGDGSTANAHQKRGVGGPNDQIGTNAAGAVFGVIQHTQHDGGHRDDHDHFNSDGSEAEKRTKGAVDQVSEDELVHFRS